MSMSKNDFKVAFRKVISSEFSHIPYDENCIDYTFSEHFNKKMNNLIKFQRKPYYFLVNTISKRVAIIFIAFLTIFTTSMSVKAIREPVINFVVYVYESFTRYFFDGDTVKEIKKQYHITDLPNGYAQTKIYYNSASLTTIYKNDNNGIIELTQGTSSNADFYIDNENSRCHTINIENIKVNIYEWENIKQAIWSNDLYVFDMILESTNLNTEDIKKIIVSIK